MPFWNLPAQDEKSTLVLLKPRKIWCYFNDLKILFLKHSISDSEEEKQAAVYYLSIQKEALWRAAKTFSDLTCFHEDFKVEILMLYPKACDHSLADLSRLISRHTKTLISSEMELEDYYCKFLVVSHSLITKGQFFTLEQA